MVRDPQLHDKKQTQCRDVHQLEVLQKKRQWSNQTIGKTSTRGGQRLEGRCVPLVKELMADAVFNLHKASTCVNGLAKSRPASTLDRRGFVPSTRVESKGTMFDRLSSRGAGRHPRARQIFLGTQEKGPRLFGPSNASDAGILASGKTKAAYGQALT